MRRCKSKGCAEFSNWKPLMSSTSQRDKLGRFITGNSGGGRPKGSRNKLGEQFVQDLYVGWIEHGTAAISAMRRQKPAEYVKVVASILPKEISLHQRPLEEMSVDEIRDALARIAVAQSLLGDDEGTTHDGTAGTGTGKPH